MTTVLKEIVGELSSLSGERQHVAASVIHALWLEEQASDALHPEWQSELDRRNAEIESGEVELADEASMETFAKELLANEEVLDTEIRIKAVADLRRKPYFWSER